MGKDRPESLERLLTDAARQALYMRGRRRDVLNESRGIKLLHGIDANVVRSWGNPYDDTGRRHRLGRIFSHDGEALSTSISWDLLSFIFGGNLGPEGLPLVVIPPIEKEIAGILDALRRDGDQRESWDEFAEEFSAGIKKISGKSLTGENTNESLSDVLELFERILAGFTPYHVLRRIALLLTRSRIAPLADLERKLPSEVKLVLFPEDDALDQYYKLSLALSGSLCREGRCAGWRERLAAVGKWQSDVLLDHDALVLSKLQVWNAEFVRKGLPWRIVYITSDSRLFRAASKVCVEEEDQISFADQVLRHPHAYLSDDGVLGQIQDDEDDSNAFYSSANYEGVGDWLSLLTEPAKVTLTDLLGSIDDESPIPSSIHSLASEIISRKQYYGDDRDIAAKEIEDKWKSYASGAVASEFGEDDRLEGLRELRMFAEKFQAALQEHSTDLDTLRRESLSDYLRATTRLGRSVEAASKLDGQTYEPAQIFFEGWPEAAEAIARLSKWSDSEIEDSEYQKAISLIEASDQTTYAFYLGHSVYFASRGRWQSALLVVRRARLIGRSYQRGNAFEPLASGAHGREAAFFEANCQRHLARNSNDLSVARACLGDAKAILAAERNIGEYSEFADERFDLESIEIDFCDLKISIQSGESTSTTASRIESLLVRYVSMESSISERLKNTNHSDDSFSPMSIRATLLRLKRRILLSILAVSFVEASPQGEHVRQNAERSLEDLENELSTGVLLEESLCKFDRLILMAARLRRKSTHLSRSSRREFFDLMADLETSEEIHSYDRQILNVIRAVA